jgi:hypothetical protein
MDIWMDCIGGDLMHGLIRGSCTMLNCLLLLYCYECAVDGRIFCGNVHSRSLGSLICELRRTKTNIWDIAVNVAFLDVLHKFFCTFKLIFS